MLQDLKYAWRALARAPWFAATSIVTLSLGIGANTAMFTVLHAVLLTPLPYRDPGRLVRLSELRQGLPLNVSLPNFHDWRMRSRTIEMFGIYVAFGRDAIGGDGPAEAVPSGRAESQFFTVLGVQPVRGRLFSAEEETPAGPPVALISHRLWQHRFGGSDAVVGRAIDVSGESMTVIGVLPASFTLTPTDLWFPLGRRLAPVQLDRGSHPGFQAFGRLREGVSVDTAQRELTAIAEDLEREYPATNRDMRIVVRPLLDSVVGRVRPMLVLLASAVAVLLLIACGNLANVLLARGLGRERETAVRAALGAGRLQIARLFVAESLVVSLIGGAGGLLVAAWSVRVIRLLPAFLLPRASDVTVDGAVLAFAIAVSVATSVVCGALPALHLSGKNAARGLRGFGGGASRGRPLRDTLVAAQVALAFALLVAAGLMIRTMDHLTAVDPGYRPERLASIALLQTGRYGDQATATAFADRLLGDVQSSPGIAAAAIAWPLDGSWAPYMNAVDRPYPRGQEPPVRMSSVSSSFFATMGIPLRRGRVFDARDRAGSRTVAVVNQTLVDRMLPPGDPIGRRLSAVGIAALADIEIVGVVGDTLRVGLAGERLPEVYCAYAQFPQSGATVVVRAATDDPEAALRTVERRVAAIDPAVSTFNPRRIIDTLADTVGDRRLMSILLTVFAALALVLTAVGIGGVVAFVVARRTWEIGVRMALGADASDVVRMIVSAAVAPVGAGLVVGAAVAIPFSRAIRQYLFGVSPVDPLSIGLAAATLLLASLGAAFVPARRATHIQPVSALRE